jgi:hypothetical protein
MTHPHDTSSPTADDDSDLHPQDRATLDAIARGNTRLRVVLCTLARYGVALRQNEPQRARAILEALAPWPVFKAGQFLFDLMEWEDFMVDGEPPPALCRDDLVDALNLPVQWLSATMRSTLDSPTVPGAHGTTGALNMPLRWFTATAQAAFTAATNDLTRLLSPAHDTNTSASSLFARELPPLEAGYYLYREVVLGLFDTIGPLFSGQPSGRQSPDPIIPEHHTNEPNTGNATFGEQGHPHEGSTTSPENAEPQPDGRVWISIAEPNPLTLDATVSSPSNRAHHTAQQAWLTLQQLTLPKRVRPGEHTALSVHISTVDTSGMLADLSRLAGNATPSEEELRTASHEYKQFTTPMRFNGTISGTVTAPTGFHFTGGISYSYYHSKDLAPLVSSERSTERATINSGKNLPIDDTIDLDPDNQGDTIVYTLHVKADKNALPGTHRDGTFTIGNTTLPLRGTIKS